MSRSMSLVVPPNQTQTMYVWPVTPGVTVSGLLGIGFKDPVTPADSAQDLVLFRADLWPSMAAMALIVTPISAGMGGYPVTYDIAQNGNTVELKVTNGMTVPVEFSFREIELA